MLANREIVEGMLTTLNEAIQDKNLVLVQSIIFHLGNKYPHELDSILLLNENISQNQYSRNYPTKIDIKLNENLKTVKTQSSDNIQEKNVFSDRGYNIPLKPKVSQQNNQVHQPQFNNYSQYNQANQEQQYTSYDNIFSNDTKSRQNMIPNRFANSQSNNFSQGNTNLTQTKFIEQPVSNTNNIFQNNQKTQKWNNQLNINKPMTNLNPNEQFIGGNSKFMNNNNNNLLNNNTNYNQLNNFNNNQSRANQYTQFNNNIRKNECPEDLNIISNDFVNDIYNMDSFKQVMQCKNNRDKIMILCREYHEFTCSKCLFNYYRKRYPDLKYILTDKHICPICKENSEVEQSYETLKSIFGNQLFEEIQSNY